MAKGSLYSFSLWLLIGLVVLVVSSVFSEFPLDSSVPVASDYDLTEEGAADQFADDLSGYASQVDLFSAVADSFQGLFCVASTLLSRGPTKIRKQ